MIIKELYTPLVDRQQWLQELELDAFTKDQQQALWDLITRGLETKVLDTLLDKLKQADQQALIQYLSEPELQPQLTTFLDQKIPKHRHLLEATILQYKKELQSDFQRLVKKS